MNDNKDAAIRKRQQIDSSKRTMFIVVAIAAFAVGISLVVAFFLAQQIWFHTKIIGAKQETIDTIRKNIDSVDELKSNVRKLDVNDALNSVKINDDSSAVQSILDALPAEANADALGASLQTKFAGSIGGLTIERLTIGSTGGKSTKDSGSTIGFTMSVNGPADKLKELLAKFEKSIRVIELKSIDVQATRNGLTMNISGAAYYEPAQQVQLETEVVKP